MSAIEVLEDAPPLSAFEGADCGWGVGIGRAHCRANRISLRSTTSRASRCGARLDGLAPGWRDPQASRFGFIRHCKPANPPAVTGDLTDMLAHLAAMGRSSRVRLLSLRLCRCAACRCRSVAPASRCPRSTRSARAAGRRCSVLLFDDLCAGRYRAPLLAPGSLADCIARALSDPASRPIVPSRPSRLRWPGPMRLRRSASISARRSWR